MGVAFCFVFIFNCFLSRSIFMIFVYVKYQIMFCFVECCLLCITLQQAFLFVNSYITNNFSLYSKMRLQFYTFINLYFYKKLVLKIETTLFFIKLYFYKIIKIYFYKEITYKVRYYSVF